MGFEIFIARRYLASKRKVQFISIISLISVVGITVGVAALLIVLSVFNGFSGIVTDILVGFDPHIRIEKKGGFDIKLYNQVENKLLESGNVVGSSPFVSGKAMIVSRSSNKVIFIRGVDGIKINKVSGIKEKIVLGKLDLKESNNPGSIILGLTLSDRIGAIVGDEVTLVSPYTFSSGMTPFSQPLTLRFRVSGIYESNNKEYDAQYAFISITAAQQLFEMQNKISGIEARLNDIDRSNRVKSELSRKLPGNILISTWYDLHADLYSMMKIERWIAYILLCLILLVACFNMLGSLTMTVIEKRRDIGILQSMGANRKSIIKIFMFEGLLIGIIGTVLGITLGLLLIYLQQKYLLFPLDPTVYIIPAIPVEIHTMDFILVSLASIFFTAVASYYPAKRASKLIPIESIRWE